MIPGVSVIIPVYNAEAFLEESIKSILGQTFDDFELILINDGSTDSSYEIMKKYEAIDGRILIINKCNEGIVQALNQGIHLASGNYICRMDADDIAEHSRIKTQLDYMEDNDIDICGSFITKIYNDGNEKLAKFPDTFQQFSDNLVTFGRLFAHPATMFRKKVFESFEYSNFEHIEDYALWLEVFTKSDFKMSNCPRELLKYRVHEKQVSKIYKKAQRLAIVDVFYSKLSSYNGGITHEMCSIHYEVIKKSKRLKQDELTQYAVLFRILFELYFSKNLNSKYLEQLWFDTCSRSTCSYQVSSKVYMSLVDCFDKNFKNFSRLDKVLSLIVG